MEPEGGTAWSTSLRESPAVGAGAANQQQLDRARAVSVAAGIAALAVRGAVLAAGPVLGGWKLRG